MATGFTGQAICRTSDKGLLNAKPNAQSFFDGCWGDVAVRRGLHLFLRERRRWNRKQSLFPI
jgi:hypothetical protein